MAYYNNANTAINNAAAVATGAVPPQQHPQAQPQQQPQPPQLTASALTPHQQMAAPPTVLPAPHVTAAVVNGTAHPEEVISASIPVAVMPPSVTATPSMPQQAALIPAQTPMQSLQPIPQAQMPLQQAAAPSVVPPSGHHNLIKHEAEDVEQDNAVEDDNEEEQEGADDHEAVDEEGETTAKQEIEDTHHHSESGEICLF